MSRIVIIAAKRTPQGRYLGALSRRSSVELGVAAAHATLTTASITADQIDLVVIGNVLAAGAGQNIARQVAVGAGIPIEVPAYAVNMMCASGLQAVVLAAQAIRAGDVKIVLCGGTESMSNAPFLAKRSAEGKPILEPQPQALTCTILRDGLCDAFDHEHMGLGAETLAQKYGITREAQDLFALQSQRRYAQADEEGRLTDELVEVDGLKRDEHPRPNTQLEKLKTLKPVFKVDGTITAGNASGINDGAAMLVLCDEDTAKREGWQPMATFIASASMGCEPRLFGLGPVHATRKLCATAGLNLNDFDTIELNEAFAAQALACIKELDLDPDRTNPDGGAISLGHPIGASGARLMVHLAHRIARGESRHALATLCVGGGMGIAAALEK